MSKIVLGIIVVFILLFGGVYLLSNKVKDTYKVPNVSESSMQSNPHAFKDWREFTPPSGRFEVQLPATPQYAKDALVIPNTHTKRLYEMFVSEKIDGTLFMISMITYPKEVDTSNPQEMLRGVIDELRHSNPLNRLINLENSSYQSHPAIDFDMLSPQFKVQGKALMDDKTIYVLSYAARKDDFDTSEYQHFMDSFVLKPKTLDMNEQTGQVVKIGGLLITLAL